MSKTHSFFKVEALVPKHLTLSQLMGPMMRRLADSFHAAGFGCPWWLPRAGIPRRHPILQTKAPEGDSFSYSETLEYQMLGALLMLAFRPDNVMHPHLRCHFEFHVGKLLAVALTFYAHSIWGAKCRVQRYIDADADIIYMIPTAHSENLFKPSAVVRIWLLHLQWLPWFHGTLCQIAHVSCLTVPWIPGRGKKNGARRCRARRL